MSLILPIFEGLVGVQFGLLTYLWYTQRRITIERKSVKDIEDKALFEARQELAAANAIPGCRLCLSCNRVVNKYILLTSGKVICADCQLSTVRAAEGKYASK